MTRIGHAGFDTAMTGLDDLIDDEVLRPAWTLDGRAVAFTTGTAEDREGWLVTIADGSRRPLVDVAKVRHAIGQALGCTPPGRGLPFQHLAFVPPPSGDPAGRAIAVAVGTAELVVDLDSLAVTPGPPPDPVGALLGTSDAARRRPRPYRRTSPLADPMPAMEVTSPDGRYHLSTEAGDLVLRATADGRTVRLTDDGGPDLHWRFDAADPALIAMGIEAPAGCWAPDGTRIAAYRVDLAGVTAIPQVHHLKRQDEVVAVHHATAGGVLERTRLHLVDVHGSPPVPIDLGDPTDTIPVVAGWLPDSSGVLALRFDRLLRHVDVFRVDARTGAPALLFSETADTFLRIHHDVYMRHVTGLHVAPDGQHLVWASTRDGWPHLYAYTVEGELVGQLTRGAWAVERVRQITARGTVAFTAHRDPDRPYDVHVCSVPLGGGEVRQLTEEPGVHGYLPAPAGEAFLDTWSSPEQPPVHVLRGLDDGRVRAELGRADVTRLQAAGWTPPREVTALAADGETTLWGTMFLPARFDPSASYPVLEYVYGGPQSAVAPHTFSGGIPSRGRIPQALAQLGYVVVVLDARGTPGRSKAFHDVVVDQRFGDHLAPDHAGAIRQLVAEHPFMDGERVGVTGHSWGGYTSLRLLAERPDVYKAAVCSAPGFDPYSSVLYEPYLGMPQDHPARYEAAQALHLAGRVQGALMLIAGTTDFGTWADVMKMVEALIHAGTDHELVVLPGQHHVFDAVHDGYAWRRATAFLDRVLTP